MCIFIKNLRNLLNTLFTNEYFIILLNVELKIDILFSEEFLVFIFNAELFKFPNFLVFVFK